MARFESGPVTLNRQWHVLEELVGVRRGALAAGDQGAVRASRDPGRFAAAVRRRRPHLASAHEFARERRPLYAAGNARSGSRPRHRVTEWRFEWPTMGPACRREANRESSTSSSAARRQRPMADVAWVSVWRFARALSRPTAARSEPPIVNRTARNSRSGSPAKRNPQKSSWMNQVRQAFQPDRMPIGKSTASFRQAGKPDLLRNHVLRRRQSARARHRRRNPDPAVSAELVERGGLSSVRGRQRQTRAGRGRAKSARRRAA